MDLAKWRFKHPAKMDLWMIKIIRAIVEKNNRHCSHLQVLATRSQMSDFSVILLHFKLNLEQLTILTNYGSKLTETTETSHEFSSKSSKS